MEEKAFNFKVDEKPIKLLFLIINPFTKKFLQLKMNLSHMTFIIFKEGWERR